MGSKVLPQQDDDIEPLLTVKEVAEMLGYSADTVYRLIDQEGLPYFRLGPRRRRFKRSAIVSWLSARETVRVPAGEAAVGAPAPPKPGRKVAPPLACWDGVSRAPKKKVWGGQGGRA